MTGAITILINGEYVMINFSSLNEYDHILNNNMVDEIYVNQPEPINFVLTPEDDFYLQCQEIELQF